MGLICTSSRRLVYHLFLVHPDSDAPCHKTMANVSVMVSNIFTGFSATVWTAWLFFAVFIGIIIVWVYTVRPLPSLPLPLSTLTNSLLLLKGNVPHRLTKLLRNPPLRERPLPLPIRVILVLRPSNALPLPRPLVLVQSVEVYI